MASLADAPDLVGFFSYSREDDEGSGGRLSKLRELIQEELRTQLGRTKRDFRLWQDKESIALGDLWEDNIKRAVSESVFFIPIITPTAVKSRYCKFEFESFLAREKELDRSNLVFPILYVPVPALMDDRWREDPLLAIIGSRQYEQWQSLRHLHASSTEVALRVEKLCENISKALQQPWLSPQERQEAEARRVAEEERLGQEKLQQEALRAAEDERRRNESEAQRHLEEAEAEKRRQDNDRRKLEKEAAWAATKARALQFLPGKTAAGVAVAVLLLLGGIWLYRAATTPAGVTSAVVQPEKLTVEHVQETTNPAGGKTATVQIDNAGNVKGPATWEQTKAALKESSISMEDLARRLDAENREAEERIKSIKAGDGIKVDSLGLTLDGISDDLRKRYNIKDTIINGVVITGVDANSPAARNGLSPGDVIVSMDYNRVANVGEIPANFDLKSRGQVLLNFFQPNGNLTHATLSIPKNSP